MDQCPFYRRCPDKQIETAAAVHKDSREVESVNNWIEDECSRTSMMDTGLMVSAVKSDRTGRPWVEFWGDWLYGVDVP